MTWKSKRSQCVIVNRETVYSEFEFSFWVYKIFKTEGLFMVFGFKKKIEFIDPINCSVGLGSYLLLDPSILP